MKYDMLKWVASQIEAPVKQPMPFLTYPAAQHLGISVRKMLFSSENQAKAMNIIAKETNMAVAFGFMDLSVEVQCFGADIIEAENTAPYVRKKTIASTYEAEKLQIPSVNSARVPLYLKAVYLASQSIIDRPIFTFVTAPFTIAGILLGIKDIYELCKSNPILVQQVLHKATEFLIDYCKAYKAMGIQGVVLCDPMAGQLESNLVEKFSLIYIKNIISKLQDNDFVFIYHNCGNNIPYCIEQIRDIGAVGYSFGNSISLEKVAEYIPKDTIMLGNIDPFGTIRNGSSDAVRNSILELKEKLGHYKNFVPSTGCDIPYDSPWENIKVFFDACG